MKKQNLEIIKLYLDEVKKYKLLDSEQERKLFEDLGHGDEEARQKLICSNLLLVISIAGRYSNNDEELLLEYIQEGNIGLIKAIDNFDITKGFRFSTYATDWIIKYILYYRDTCLNDIKKTSQVKKHKKIIDQAIIFLEKYYGRKPTNQEIAKYTNLNLETIKKIELCYNKPISLNKKIDDEEETEHINYIQSKSLSVEEEAISNYIRELIYSYLNPDEIELLKMRYGLQDQKIYTQDEIGAFYGVTKKAISLRESKIKEKLRKKTSLKGLF